METSRGWQELGVVDTIYEDDLEEEDDDDDHEEQAERFDSPTMSSSPPTSRSSSPEVEDAAAAAAHPSLPPALRRAVQAWCREKGSRKPDVVVRVQEHRLPLHRDVITSRSSYLGRLLSESSDVAIALPAGLSFDAFVQAIATCYVVPDDAAAALSPASFAAAWVAEGWLELGAPGRDPCGLVHAAEDYFHEVATDHGRAAAVLRCCAAFLGGEAAGPAADLLVRCVEVLAASDSGSGRWLDDVAALPVEEFLVAVEAMRARSAHDHDLMYTVVDHYLENHKGKLTEEDKSRLCYNVNCTKLSQHLFMHLVQNPRLPLRFVVQAMLVEQLHSHHTMLLTHHHQAAALAPTRPAAPLLKPSLSGVFRGGGVAGEDASMTLGDILQRDAALHQSAHIRASMQATSLRIETLERELAGLRSRLRRSEQQQAETEAAAAAAAATGASSTDRAPGKSASFRIPRSRLWDGEELAPVGLRRAAARDSSARGFKSRLVHGFKNLFGRRQGAAGAPSACGEDSATRCFGDKGAAAAAPELESDDGEVVSMEERWRPHRRNHSIV